MDRRAQYPIPREEDSSEEISLIRPSNVHVLMFALYLFAGLLLFASGFCAIAHAQANGTVIILELTPRGLFVAADSRSVVGTKTEDNHCKLVTLTNNSIFAVAGGSSYSAGKTDRAPSFDAIEEAKRAAVDSRTSSTAAQMLAVTADSWTNRMLANSNAIRKWHPDVIEEGAKKEKGLVTTGIFAKGWNGSIFMAFRQSN